MDNNLLPWEEPQVKLLLTIFDAVVYKIDTKIRKVENNEDEIYR